MRSLVTSGVYILIIFFGVIKNVNVLDAVRLKLSSSKWDYRFLSLAKYISSWSKDPSTKCGAVIVDKHKIIKALGFNGYCRGMIDDEKSLDNRQEKYSYIVHAETNAILNANGSIRGCSLYVWPMAPCNECAKSIIQSGIKYVFSLVDVSERWEESQKIAENMFRECGVVFTYIKPGEK